MAAEEVLDAIAEEVLDLVVIGAGPHALSLLGRLATSKPDLLSEAERVQIMRRHGARSRPYAAVKAEFKRRYKPLPRTVVVDAHGRWMAQWAHDFEALGIRHLRSHADLHPCPFDFQSLRVWAAAQGRDDEFQDMPHLDREQYRKAGFGAPYLLPSTELFLDFCESIVDRYGLAELVRQGTVVDVRIIEHDESCLFHVHLADGRVLRARRVVCAMGPGHAFKASRDVPPWWVDELAGSLSAASLPTDTVPPKARLQHSSLLTTFLRSPDADRAIAGSRVLVVGGGQTAAHLALVALRHAASSVTIASRRKLTCKPFDVDLALVGDRRAAELRKFWRLELDDRYRAIAAMRGGGSMSPGVRATLALHEQESSSSSSSSSSEKTTKRLVVAEEVEVDTAAWIDDEITLRFQDGGATSADFVWLATGATFDVELVPILASLQEQKPIPIVGGLPVLQPDLAWAANVPFYVMGAFAQLQLGADALNLAGARAGGVLVAKSLSKP